MVIDTSAPVEVGLTVSSQLPLEAIAMGTGSVYTCQKSFRAEKSDTNKHLAEFLHVEFEQYFLTLDQLMDQAERFVKHVVRTTIHRCEHDGNIWGNSSRAHLCSPTKRVQAIPLVEPCIGSTAIDGLVANSIY